MSKIRLFALILLVQASFKIFAQKSLPDRDKYAQYLLLDGEVVTQFVKSTLVLKSGDTLVIRAKHNRNLYDAKIELEEGGKIIELATSEVLSLSYWDNQLDFTRTYKNIEELDGPSVGQEVFAETYFENRYFVTVRSITFRIIYPGTFKRISSLYIINKTSKTYLKDLTKKTFYNAMADKKEEMVKYIKDNKLSLNSIWDQNKLFMYYESLHE